MKDILLKSIVVLLAGYGFLILIIQTGFYIRSKTGKCNYPSIDYIVFDKDTVVIEGARVIDVGKIRATGGKYIQGHNDTVNHIFITTIHQK